MSVRAYHFVGDTLLDGRPVPADGEWLEHDGPIVICVSGLHASRRPWHALTYAPGPVLCVVEVEGIEAERRDKLVARRRRIVRRVDLTDDLRAFARQCALDVIHLWDAPDAVRRYLETGDASLREAAWNAAWDAACTVACDVAWDATRAAAWSATRAAWDATRADAWEAAGAASWEAVWATAYDTARARAYDATTLATYGTAWNAYGERFDALCAARLEESPDA
jgi:hypothetical protein